jgi:hypothetical protein
MKTLEQRLAKLERDNRLWRLAACSLLVLGLLGVGVAAQRTTVPAKQLKSQEFVLVDGDGKEIGTFGEVNGGAGLMVTSDGGSVSLAAMAGGCGISVNSDKGHKVQIEATSKGDTAGIVASKEASKVSMLADSEEGMILTYDKVGKVTWLNRDKHK